MGTGPTRGNASRKVKDIIRPASPDPESAGASANRVSGVVSTVRGMRQRRRGTQPRGRRAVAWCRTHGRASVAAPCIAPGIGAREEERRRPIVAELRRVYGLAMLNLALLMLVLVPGVLLCAYMSGHGTAAPLHLPEVVRWVRVERVDWKTEVLLGLPISVLFPSVLTVLLSTAPTSPGGDSRTAREEAFLEVVRSLLYLGLVLGAAFALLAAIPPEGRSDLPGVLLSVAIAVGCVLLSGTLRVDGTQKDLLVAKALGRREAALKAQLLLKEHLEAHASWATPLLRSGHASHGKVVAIGVILLGTVPAGGLGLWSLTQGHPRSWLSWLVGLAGLAGYLGGQALFLVFLGSRRRLATTRREQLTSLGFLLVPAAVLGFSTLVLALVPTDPESRTVLWVFAICLALADGLAILLDRTVFATIVDYRRLSALQSYAEGQAAYLTDERRPSSAMGDLRFPRAR